MCLPRRQTCECPLTACIQDQQKVLRFSQWAAMKAMKLLLLEVQQSVVGTFLIANVALSGLSRTVVQDMMEQFGCRSWIRLWNAGCSTRENRWRPWTIKFRIALLTLFWKTCIVSSSFICVRFVRKPSDFLLQAVVVNSLYFSSCLVRFFYKDKKNTDLWLKRANSNRHQRYNTHWWW